MVSKWSQEERRRRKAAAAAQISTADLDMLEQLRTVRRYVGGSQLIDTPRAIASYELWLAIEKWAEVVTGQPQYFWDVRNG
ncbi:hypothetical protein [Rhodopseudomonas sp. RCAM05734]|uniref:hypothetical protein n=1 Tax=Rhodopseudomonas sp. RCAM05734 TaxID=3457549 RepID=UPI004044CE9E